MNVLQRKYVPGERRFGVTVWGIGFLVLLVASGFIIGRCQSRNPKISEHSTPVPGATIEAGERGTISDLLVSPVDLERRESGTVSHVPSIATDTSVGGGGWQVRVLTRAIQGGAVPGVPMVFSSTAPAANWTVAGKGDAEGVCVVDIPQEVHAIEVVIEWLDGNGEPERHSKLVNHAKTRPLEHITILLDVDAWQDIRLVRAMDEQLLPFFFFDIVSGDHALLRCRTNNEGFAQVPGRALRLASSVDFIGDDVGPELVRRGWLVDLEINTRVPIGELPGQQWVVESGPTIFWELSPHLQTHVHVVASMTDIYGMTENCHVRLREDGVWWTLFRRPIDLDDGMASVRFRVSDIEANLTGTVVVPVTTLRGSATIAVAMHDAAYLRGQLVDADGIALENVETALMRQDTFGGSRAVVEYVQVDSRGQFDMITEPGSVSFIYANAYRGSCNKELLLHPGENRHQITLSPPEGAVVDGVIQTSGDAHEDIACVVLLRLNRSSPETLVAQTERIFMDDTTRVQFSFPFVPRGLYELQLRNREDAVIFSLASPISPPCTGLQIYWP